MLDAQCTAVTMLCIMTWQYGLRPRRRFDKVRAKEIHTNNMLVVARGRRSRSLSRGDGGDWRKGGTGPDLLRFGTKPNARDSLGMRPLLRAN